ncbi:MAG: nucleoside hydrolase [Coriobacteriia bacterium]|nr:nucleoside hydrolase [Coriobacteriia bacterium]
MKKTKIILDCDPGVDDAIALIIACKHPSIELLGITTVCGNVWLDKTTQNAINVVKWLGVDYPVYAGCDRPLLIDKRAEAVDLNGESGIKGMKFPKYSKQPESKHAVNYIIDTLMASDGDITVVTTGPMTNLAMALRMEPKITDKIKSILLMGGAIGRGNVTPSAEFNLIYDAEAANICFRSGRPIRMVGLDVTERALCYPETVEHFAKYNNPASELFCNVCKYYMKVQYEVYQLNGGPLHDPLAVATLVNPDVVTFKPAYTTVEVRSDESYGRTNCDLYLHDNKKPNSEVATDLDRDLFFKVLEDCVSLY